MDNLDEYIKYFKSLSLKEKQSIILDELKMITGLTNQMCKEIEANNEILLNKELASVNNSNYTEDDFSEAVITYICSIKNSLCDFSDKLTEISDNME